MKVVVLNGSPLMGKGNTSLILTPLLEGLEEGGAEVEVYFTAKLNVKPCRGCLGCWVKTPGHCIQDDDMGSLLQAMREADIWLLATPLYMDGMPGPMKIVIDRLAPLALPFMEVHNNQNYHLMRQPQKQGKIALVANCGFWELEQFDSLLVFVKTFCRNIRRDFSGALLRPHGPAMRFTDPDVLQGVFSAARLAGRELAESGSIDSGQEEKVAQQLLPRDRYIALVNKGFRDILDERKLPY